MVRIQLPENPNNYIILLAFFCFFLSFSFLIGGRNNILFWTFAIAGTILFILGFNGLKKTQDLKDKRIKEEIRLLQVQQDKTDAEVGRIQIGG